jgi:hypothetical protein
MEGLNPRRCGEWGIDVREDQKCMRGFNLNPEGESFLIDFGTDVSVILIWPFRKQGRGFGLN